MGGSLEAFYYAFGEHDVLTIGELPDEEPTLYPVACSPQARAAGSVFYLLHACLGLSFSPDKPKIRLRNWRLPPFVDQIETRALSI